MITTVPFQGFYCSDHDHALDQAIEQMFQDDRGDANHGLVEAATWACDWKKVHATYASKYVEAFAAEFEIRLKFESLKSPREYNFSTDIVYATISQRQVRELFRDTDKATLDKVAASRFTSCSGFISFYSPEWRTWGSVDTWDHNQVGTLLECLIEKEGRTRWNSYGEFDLMQVYRDNGDFDDWICSAIPQDELRRFFRIHQYLLKRQARNLETT